MLNKNLSFYQVSKHVLNKFGLEVAMVHSIVWNASKLEGMTCMYGAAEIGNEIGISYKKVGRCLKTLLTNGYIELVYGENKYHTKSYRFVPEKIIINISEEEYQENSVRTNNKRIEEHHKRWDKTSPQNQMIQNVTSEGTNRHTRGDKTSPQRGQTVPLEGTNRPPIKNLKNLNIYKEIKEGDFSLKTKPQQTQPEHYQIVKDKLEKKLRVVMEGKRWEEFIRFVCEQEKENKPVERFIKWWLVEETSPKYWTPERMRMLYPQAFIEEEDTWTVEPIPTTGRKELTDEEYRNNYLEYKEKMKKEPPKWQVL